jgi:hypothetical protein
MDGLTIDSEGIAKYSMAMEVTNPAGRVILEQKPTARVEFAPLRGNRLPGRAYVIVGLDETPGVYSCKLSVTDTVTKLTANLAVKFEVLKKEFAIVAVFTSHDQKGEISAPTTGQVGDTRWIQFTVASFERDPKTKQPNVYIEFQFFDEKGKALLVNEKNELVPRKHEQDEKSLPPVKDGDGAFTLQFPVFLNRPGKFLVEMTAHDKVTGKKFLYKLPLTATAAY